MRVGESGSVIKVFAIPADVKNIYRPDLILDDFYKVVFQHLLYKIK